MEIGIASMGGFGATGRAGGFDFEFIGVAAFPRVVPVYARAIPWEYPAPGISPTVFTVFQKLPGQDEIPYHPPWWGGATEKLRNDIFSIVIPAHITLFAGYRRSPV